MHIRSKCLLVDGTRNITVRDTLWFGLLIFENCLFWNTLKDFYLLFMNWYSKNTNHVFVIDSNHDHINYIYFKTLDKYNCKEPFSNNFNFDFWLDMLDKKLKVRSKWICSCYLQLKENIYTHMYNTPCNLCNRVLICVISFSAINYLDNPVSTWV